MYKLFYFIVVLLSGCWRMPSIAMLLENLTAKPQGTTISEAPYFETTPSTNCTFQQLQPRDVIPEKGDLIIKEHNLTLPKDQPYVYDPILKLCFTRSATLNKEIFDKCLKRECQTGEFRVLQNGSVMLHDDILEPGSYAIKDGTLEICVDTDSNDGGNSTGNIQTGEVSHQGKMVESWYWRVGSLISVIASTAHLVTFCLVPTLRNLPGYNLASLSGAFLLGYLFSLIGQIPQVVGLFCMICGVFQQVFFLAAIFCMNTLAFDVWRTIRMSTKNLAFYSNKSKRHHLIYYSIYSWGTPLLITATSAAIDNIEGTPIWMKPGFGLHDACWMTNKTANIMFFNVPAFALIVMNGIFFVMCAFLIKKNTIKCTREELRRTDHNNFVLYVRLGLMIGLTWLFGIVAMIANNYIVWNMFDIMNSLQGLFVFLLVICSKKVFSHIREKFHLDAVALTPKTSGTNIAEKTG